MTREDNIIDIVIYDPKTPSFQQEHSDLYTPEYLAELNARMVINQISNNKGTSGIVSSSPTGRALFPLES